MEEEARKQHRADKTATANQSKRTATEVASLVDHIISKRSRKNSVEENQSEEVPRSK